MRNTTLVTKDYMKQRQIKWQKDNVDTVLKIGDIVKIPYVGLSYDNKEITEHMWFTISSISENGQILEGTCNNDPLAIVNIKYEDKVTFNRDQIEQLF